MPIAETVARLARCIGEARSPLSEWEQNLCSILQDMPSYRDRHELDAWYDAFDDAWETGVRTADNPDGYFETPRLFLQVFELGTCNLYTEFSEGRSLGAYRTLVRELNIHHEIDAPNDLDVSDW